ncbi:MAG TPA: tetratricopeptide repeat protein [Nitrospirales bacterium]|nr:tetratricopeptide repeat protein [Nitrospirales bacterium]
MIVLATLPACASRATKAPPARVPMPSSEVIASILQAGRQAAAQGQFDRAINLFRRVQEGYPSAPDRPEATLLLAQTLERNQEIASALTEYRRLVSEYPQSPQAVLAHAKIPDLERQLPVVRLPGVQLLGAYVGPEDLESLDERELNRLRQSGTNTVVVGIARNRASITVEGGPAKGAPPTPTAAGVYFKTDWAPVIQDRLAAVVGAAHRQSLQFWAAVSVRRMDWVDPALGWADWRYIPRTGQLEPAETLDLLHPGLRDYLVGFFTDLAATGIDGMLLLADPPSAANEGFSPQALRRYERDVGQALDPGRLLLTQGRDQTLTYAPEFWRWAGWKQREYAKALEGVMGAVRASYPALKVGMEVHPETITSPQTALASYAEDLLDLRRYRYDYIAIAGMSSPGAMVTKAAEIVRGDRLLLLVDPTEKNKGKIASLPLGTGLIYKEKSAPPRLTNQAR